MPSANNRHRAKQNHGDGDGGGVEDGDGDGNEEEDGETGIRLHAADTFVFGVWGKPKKLKVPITASP